jgi:hypothetical protein
LPDELHVYKWYSGQQAVVVVVVVVVVDVVVVDVEVVEVVVVVVVVVVVMQSAMQEGVIGSAFVKFVQFWPENQWT